MYQPRTLPSAWHTISFLPFRSVLCKLAKSIFLQHISNYVTSLLKSPRWLYYSVNDGHLLCFDIQGPASGGPCHLSGVFRFPPCSPHSSSTLSSPVSSLPHMSTLPCPHANPPNTVPGAQLGMDGMLSSQCSLVCQHGLSVPPSSDCFSVSTSQTAQHSPYLQPYHPVSP